MKKEKEMEGGKKAREVVMVDRRVKEDEGETFDAEIQEFLKPTYIQELEKCMREKDDLIKQYREELLRMREENRNALKRVEKDMERRLGIEKQALFLPFLKVMDSLERTIEMARNYNDIEDFLTGIELIRKQMSDIFTATGITPIEAEGRPFDPSFHEAVDMAVVDDPSLDGMIVEEVERGYMVGDQVLRAAKVRVGRIDA